MPDLLDAERRLFDQNRETWAKEHPGTFVLVKGDRLVGFFDTQADALAQGTRLGFDDFLVRPVEYSEEEIYIPALSLGLLRARS